MIDINILPVQPPSQSATVDANIARFQTPPRSAPAHTHLQPFANFHPIIVDNQVLQSLLFLNIRLYCSPFAQ